MRACPNCKSRVTKRVSLNTGEVTCQICGHKYFEPTGEHKEAVGRADKAGLGESQSDERVVSQDSGDGSMTDFTIRIPLPTGHTVCVTKDLADPRYCTHSFIEVFGPIQKCQKCGMERQLRTGD